MSLEQAADALPPVVGAGNSNVWTSTAASTADEPVPSAWRRAYVSVTATQAAWILFSATATCDVDSTATSAGATTGVRVPANTIVSFWVPGDAASFAVDLPTGGQVWIWPSSIPASSI